MIKELAKVSDDRWNEVITLQLTLEDLQYIYDCVGAVPPPYIKEKHTETPFKEYADKCTVNVGMLYEELDDIITRHGGVNDGDDRVNLMDLGEFFNEYK